MPTKREPEPETELTLSISLQQKVKTANQYEMAELFLNLGGITMGTTPDEMDEMLDGQGKIAYQKLANKMREITQELRKGY